MTKIMKARRIADHIKCARAALRNAATYPSWGIQFYSINGGPAMLKDQLLERIEINKKNLRELLNETM